jgi:thiosulfate dehydrogenase (quinone) large subunit
MTATRSSRRGAVPATEGGRLRSDSRRRDSGWALLPLRAYLGVTFLYAGASKLLDEHYLSSSSPLGVRSQMLRAAAASPIGGLVSFSADHATLTGLMIAFGEIAVGLGTLLGLMPRLAAAGGALLALSFFLTVSWTTHPYYYGADIGVLFAWLPLVVAGDGGLFSLGATFHAQVRRRLDLPPEPTLNESRLVRNEVRRRTLLREGTVAAVVGTVTVAAGSLVAQARRASGSGTPSSESAAAASSSTPAASGSAGAGTVIAQAASVAVGSAKAFTAAGGQQAYLLHPAADTFVAFDATCTHQGCPVSFVGPGFRCPCHGATYDAAGQVTGGPAPAPLTKIPVKVVDGNVTTT